jgi:hypothetical protein
MLTFRAVVVVAFLTASAWVVPGTYGQMVGPVNPDAIDCYNDMSGSFPFEPN